jgi:hypothetical protein
MRPGKWAGRASGEDIVEIEVQLADHTNVVAACTIDGNDRLGGELELVAYINHAWIDGSRRALSAVEVKTSLSKLSSTIGIIWLMNSGKPKSRTLDFR